MYKITNNSRRITQSILNEAYKWLYKEIEERHYAFNKSNEAKELILRIQTEGKVTHETYEEFIELFDKSPFSYMTYKHKSRNSKFITTDILMNYFVDFNGSILPMGFLVYYFEDDYETREERSALIKKFIENEKNELSVNARRELLRKEVENNSLVEHNPQVFKTPAAFFVCNTLRIALWAFALFLFSTFCKATHYLSIFGNFVFNAQFDGSVVIKGDYTPVTDYLANFRFTGLVTEVEEVTYGTFLSFFLMHSIVNALLLIFIISYTVKVIRFIIALSFIIKFRVEIARQSKFKDILEDGGIQEFQSYFDNISDSLAENGEITDDLCTDIPPVKKVYTAVMTHNSKETAEKIKKLHGNFVFKSVTLNYATEQGRAKAKKIWRKGFVPAFIWLIAFSIIDLPGLYESVLPAIGNMLTNIFS